MQNRVFFPQAALDQWLADGSIELRGTELSILAEARRYRLAEAAHVTTEVTGTPDAHELLGRVKSKQYLDELGAELLESSMILGDNAYDVVPGWLASPLFQVLRRGKAVRGTMFDLFGYQAERKAERALIEQYIADLRAALPDLRPETLATVIELASLPDTIRGFGPVKDSARSKAETKRQALLATLQAPRPELAIAAE